MATSLSGLPHDLPISLTFTDSEAPREFNDLPQELKDKILMGLLSPSYFQNDLTQGRLVCREWNQIIISNPLLCRKLVYLQCIHGGIATAKTPAPGILFEKSIREQALQDIAVVQAASDIEGALATATAISDMMIKSQAEVNVLAVQAASDLEKALALTQRICDIDSSTYNEAIHAIAVVQAASDVEGALVRARTIKDPKEKDSALHDIAIVQAATDLAGALATAETISRVRIKEKALHAIAIVQASSDIEGALAAARTINAANGWQAYAVSQIAMIQAKSNIEAAKATLRTIDDPISNSYRNNLPPLIAAQAVSDIEGALVTAGTISEPYERDRVLAAVLEVLTASNSDRALSIAQGIGDESLRNKVLHGITSHIIIRQAHLDPRGALARTRTFTVDHLRIGFTTLVQVAKVVQSTIKELEKESR